MAPILLDILKRSLSQVEHSVVPIGDDPAVIELRKQVARSCAELELIKSERREISRRMFLVTPRLHRPQVESESDYDDPDDAA